MVEITWVFTFGAKGNAINIDDAPSVAEGIADNTVYGGETGESIYGLSGNDFLQRCRRHPQKRGCHRARQRVIVV